MSEFLSDESFERFRTLIYDESGIHFSSTNRSILESRLKERLRVASLSDVEEYYRLITREDGEMKVLLDSVTTNLTRFFRNTSHFQTFEYYVVPELIKAKSATADRTIRLWSAGCSTGEEPYSVAIMLKELLPPTIRFEIVGSDLSLKSLMTGQEGFYAENRMNGVPERFLAKYFERKAGGYQVVPEIKQTIRFDYHNLKNDSGLRGMDVIMCRNVLIYFDEAAQRAVVNRFWDAMADHGFLFIGHSESLFGMNTQFEFLRTDWACIYEKRATK